MKKILLLVPILFISIFLAGCTMGTAPTDQNTYLTETITMNKNQGSLVKNTPIPTLKDSLERKNISKRAELFNTPNKISYIYLINYGKIMAFHTVSGKVSSLRSYMVPQEKLVTRYGDDCVEANNGLTSGYDCYSVSAPDIDGSYGENVDGIFFFTTEGSYVEWKGDYMMSDQPFTLMDKPSLIREIK